MSIEIPSLLDTNLFWPATIVFLLSFIFYIYKFLNTRNMTQNLNTEHFANQRPSSNLDRNIQNNSNENNNRVINNNFNTEDDFTNKILIFFQSTHNNLKEPFNIKLDNSFKEELVHNIYKKLKIDKNKHKVVIIHRGKKIDESTIIKNIEGLEPNSVIHLFVTELILNSNDAQMPNSSHNEYSNSNENSNNDNINESVNINTIKAHAFILIIVSFLIYQIKNEQDLIPKAAINIFFVIVAFWWSQLSYMISKLIINKKINYN